VTPVEAWARAFALTVAVELAVAPLLLRPGEASLARRLATVFVAQLASHPVVWFVLPELALRRTAFLAVAEG
jgi:hypothetical protein